jgi:phosphoribosylformylglycinamidine cyclo-ligase
MIEDFYSKAGVSSEEEENALGSLIKWVNATFSFRDKIGKALLPIGFFANVIDTSLGIGIAISTDGVGTKTLIAELLNKYDTIGIDCIAMNVNDILCVGAEPVSFVDYIAVNKVENAKIEEISKGLYEGAKLANINIPGGEIAQSISSFCSFVTGIYFIIYSLRYSLYFSESIKSLISSKLFISIFAIHPLS